MSPGMEVDKWIAVHEWVIGPKLRDFAKLAGCNEAEALGISVYTLASRRCAFPSTSRVGLGG